MEKLIGAFFKDQVKSFPSNHFAISADDDRRIKGQTGTNKIFLLHNSDNIKLFKKQANFSDLDTTYTNNHSVKNVFNPTEIRNALILAGYEQLFSGSEIYERPNFNENIYKESFGNILNQSEIILNTRVRYKKNESHIQLVDQGGSFQFLYSALFPKIFGYKIKLCLTPENEYKLVWELFYNLSRSEIQPNWLSLKNLNWKSIDDVAFSIRRSVKRNLLISGPPGTGKSNLVKNDSEDFFNKNNISRITFYPEYSYSKFVGSYKPNTYYKAISIGGKNGQVYYKDRNAQETLPYIVCEPVIDYSFTPGVLLEHLVKAYNCENEDDNFLLIIEELNRANASAVFGEVFQLLDRYDESDIGNGQTKKRQHESKYPVKLSAEAMDYLQSAVKNINTRERLKKYGLFLPHNFFIWATMNSGDQGVFPLDAAFKRRWHPEYIYLDKFSEENDSKITFGHHKIDWSIFRKELNNNLRKLSINEDKLISPYFLRKSELQDSNSVMSKLIIYLFDDVLKNKQKDGIFASSDFRCILEFYFDIKVESAVKFKFRTLFAENFINEIKEKYQEKSLDFPE